MRDVMKNIGKVAPSERIPGLNRLPDLEEG